MIYLGFIYIFFIIGYTWVVSVFDYAERVFSDAVQLVSKNNYWNDFNKSSPVFDG